MPNHSDRAAVLHLGELLLTTMEKYDDSDAVDPLETNALERIRSGDANSYDVLVSRYLSRAYSVAWGILRNGSEAEEVVQEAFVRGFEKLPSFRAGASFGPWILRIVANLALDVQRRSRRFPHEPIDQLDERAAESDPLLDTRSRDLAARIDAALQELPAMQQLVARLYLIEALPHAEIAQITGLSVSTVRSHLTHARRKLQLSLADLYEGGTDARE